MNKCFLIVNLYRYPHVWNLWKNLCSYYYRMYLLEYKLCRKNNGPAVLSLFILLTYLHNIRICMKSHETCKQTTQIKQMIKRKQCNHFHTIINFVNNMIIDYLCFSYGVEYLFFCLIIFCTVLTQDSIIVSR